MRRPVRLALLLAALAGSALTGCGGGDSGPDAASATTAPAGAPTTSGDGGSAPAEAGPDAVTVKTFAFQPGELTVDVGDTVTWTNADRTVHTVTAGTPERPGDAFDAELDGPGATATHRFDAAGTITYFCRRHPSMTGSVTAA